MAVLKLFFGILFFILGWIYLYKSNLVITLNRIARDVLFNDRLILLERKKLAVVFFCLSFIALYMGLTSLASIAGTSEKSSWMMEPHGYLMYMAMQDYYRQRYASAIDKYQRVLKEDPDHFEALKRITYAYIAAGEKKRARASFKRLIRINPKDPEVAEKIRTHLNALK
ncbi:MAG: tetratricopeptide repeat protein [Elusimicrobiota bacterium]